MLVLTATLVLAACGGDDDGSGSSGVSDPASVVEGYVAAYNAQDIERVMAFFAEDAVIIGDGGAERVEGAEAIRAEQLGNFDSHAPGGEAYSISNLQATDNVVTWAYVFMGDAHTCVGTGDEAVVEDGEIVTWTRGPGSCD